jgi:thiamine biosynthesis protein ThiI
VHVVVHYAEIGLKGRNRPRFEAQLLDNLSRALAPLGTVRGRRLFGRLMLELPDDVPFAEVERRLERSFGVANFGRATVCEPTLAAIERAVDAFIAERPRFASFGVRARRPEKQHDFSSRDVERVIGSRVQAATGARVDLGDPELWIEIHVLSREAIVRHERFPGPGGIPVGSSGHAVALISGGIDSPVAAWLAAKRGCLVSFVHFHSAPFTSAASQAKVRDLVGALTAYTGPVRLHLVPFGELQQTLLREAPAEPRIVLYRRFMLRIAERVAVREGALALVTGDSLGQVSSQTLGNLDTINRAATLPVLRPLVGMDKAEIIALARRIGTFEISIEPDEDCCSYLMPRRPATWTRPDALEEIERKLDVKGLVDDACARIASELVAVRA